MSSSRGVVNDDLWVWGQARVAAASSYAAQSGIDVATWLERDAWVSGCLTEEIRVLEVFLRQAAHQELSGAFGATWWTTAPLTDGGRRKVDWAIQTCTKRYGPRAASDPNRVIPELTLGFWSWLFTEAYSRSLWPILRGCFAGSVTRKRIHQSLADVTSMRNKIAHQELVYHRDHEGLHYTIMDLCGRLGPSHLRTFNRISRYENMAAENVPPHLVVASRSHPKSQGQRSSN